MVNRALINLFAFGLISSVIATAQTTRTANTCAVSDVQTQVNASANGDTVVIPSCPQTNWSTTLQVNKCITIKGAGQGSTTIGDNVTKNGTDASGAILFNVSCSTGTVDLSNLTIVGVATDANVYNKGHVRLLGTMQSFRIHHITINNPTTSFLTTNTTSGGLIDHLTDYCIPTGKGSINLKASGTSGYGDSRWAMPDSSFPGASTGTVFVEDNTFNCGSGVITGNVLDADSGAAYVFRFNTGYNVNAGSHGTDSSQRERSVRWIESYKNNVDYNICNVSGCSPDFFTWVRGGSGIVWGNTITTPWINQITKADNLRDSGSYTPWGQCNGTSVYDQNSIGGYRCVDQPGSGQSRDLGGVNPPSSSWVGNSLFPIYTFNNTRNGSAYDQTNSTPNVAANRDYYVLTSTFNGSSGIGSGPLANRPSTCTTGVGYWATDQGSWNKSGSGGQGVLYKCTAPNTWTLYYTPYTYPHPLQTGGGGGTGVMAPSALQAVPH